MERVIGAGDAEIARLAELQRGLVHRRQLLAAGITPDAIKHRLTTRRLHAIFRDVYLVGRPRLEPLGAAMAAIMHFDGAGVLSHRTAGRVWGLIECPELPVEVTVTGVDARSRRNVTVYRRHLEAVDVRGRDRLLVTAPARTIVDLAGVLDADELEAALAHAFRRRLVTRDEVGEALRRQSRPKGSAALRALLEQPGGQLTFTRSVYERKLKRLLARAQLPPPEVNARVDGMEVDFLWRERRLIVEFDSFAYHSGRRSFEHDRLRDQRLTAAGYRVIRITARQLDQTPEAVIARLAAALVQR